MIGARIAALRKRSGLSQSDLAQQLQCSASAVGMYEQGRREPSADLLVRLARLFDVSTDYLLTGAVPEHRDQQALAETLLLALNSAEQMGNSRPERPFSRQELALLLAALLTQP